MLLKIVLTTILTIGFCGACLAQNETKSEPSELDVLKGSLGIWDAEIEVWPQGPESPSITFQGVETNRPYGKHWIASDFDSEYGGQTMKVHSILGFDLDQKKLVGTVIDHGPYSASMSGDYDSETKTITWITKAKGVDGKPMLQKTTVTQQTEGERVLVLVAPGKTKDEYSKVMEIKFTKRK